MKINFLVLFVLMLSIINLKAQNTNFQKTHILLGSNYSVLSLPLRDGNLGYGENVKYKKFAPRFQFGALRKINKYLTMGLILRVRKSSSETYAVFTEKYYFLSTVSIDSTQFSHLRNNSKSTFATLEVPFQFDFQIIEKKNFSINLNLGIWGGIRLKNSVSSTLSNDWSKIPPQAVLDKNSRFVGPAKVDKFGVGTFGAFAGLTFEAKKYALRLHYNLQTSVSDSNQKYDNSTFEFSVLRVLNF